MLSVKHLLFRSSFKVLTRFILNPFNHLIHPLGDFNEILNK